MLSCQTYDDLPQDADNHYLQVQTCSASTSSCQNGKSDMNFPVITKHRAMISNSNKLEFATPITVLAITPSPYL